MARWKMLGEIIAQIGETFVPINAEVPLFGAVHDPEIAHVHGFGTLDLNAFVGNTVSGAVIGFERRRALGKIEISERIADRFGLACVVKKTTEFAFGRRGDYFLHLVGDNENGAIHWRGKGAGVVRIRGLAAKVEITTIA